MRLPLSITARSRFFIALKFALVGLLPPSLCGQANIEAWGIESGSQYDYGQVTETPDGARFIQVEGGSFHSLALRADGSIAAWGIDYPQVLDTPSGTGFTQVAAGWHHSLALRSNGSIASWGSDTHGLVSDTPGGTGFIQIAGGWRHAVAMRADGSLVSWGWDGGEFIGIVSDTPVESGFTQIAAGATHSLALRADGSIVSWGIDSVSVVSDTPTDSGFIHVEGGGSTSMALRADGSIEVWGSDTFGLISGKPEGNGFIQVATEAEHALALHADGSIVSWGIDTYGQTSESPVGTGFVQVEAGYAHSLALRAQNTGLHFCSGDGTAASCPCGASGNPGEGCANSSGVWGGSLMGSGDAYFDGDDFSLLARGLPAGAVGLCVKGSGQIGGGLGNPVGDGILCIAPQIRSQVIVSDASGSFTMSDWRGQPFGMYPGAANVGAPTYYQWWYRDPSNTCSGQGFNFTNGWSVDWVP